MDPAEELTADVIYQIGALQAMARVSGAEPSGTSNRMARCTTRPSNTRSQAGAVVDAVLAVDPTLPVLGLPGSALLDIAAFRGLRAVPEAFADRGYTPAGTLASRSEDGAVLSDPAAGRRPGGPDDHGWNGCRRRRDGGDGAGREHLRARRQPGCGADGRGGRHGSATTPG